MMLRKTMVLLVVLTLVVGLGVGCKPATEPAEETPAETTPTETPETPEENVLLYNVGTEPESLDTARITGQPELTVAAAIFEGLARLDENGISQPAMAESWKVSDDGLVWTITIRDGVKWANGEPVTAEDFKYAWLRALDPDTAADYAYQMYYIKGGLAYNSGEGSAEDVGIEVVDERTLKVTLEAPTPYFQQLLAFGTYYPVHKATAEDHGQYYGAEANRITSNGPFKLVNWEHNSKLELVPNEDYWDRDAVKLDKIIMYCVEEASTELAMFETDELDIMDNPPLPEIDRLKNEGLVLGADLATYYALFNTTAEPLDDVRVRKALTYAIDRNAIVTNITKAGQKPALAFVPYGIPNPATGVDFREEGGDYYQDHDLDTAKSLLAEAGFPDGQGLPELPILTNKSEAHVAIYTAIGEMWKTGLGVPGYVIDQQEWQVYLATRDALDYVVSRAGWGADYVDPMTFLDMWVTGGGNNNTGWGDAEYDKMVAECNKLGDQAARYEMMHEMEDLLMEDMPIAPIYFYTDPYMYKPWAKGIIKNVFGASLDFKHAYIEK